MKTCRGEKTPQQRFYTDARSSAVHQSKNQDLKKSAEKLQKYMICFSFIICFILSLHRSLYKSYENRLGIFRRTF